MGIGKELDAGGRRERGEANGEKGRSALIRNHNLNSFLWKDYAPMVFRQTGGWGTSCRRRGMEGRRQVGRRGGADMTAIHTSGGGTGLHTGRPLRHNGTL